LNILYTSDDKFAEIAGVSILSLFENNKDADEINIYLIASGISEVNKQRLTGISESYGRKIIFTDAPDIEKIAGTAIDTGLERWSLTVFCRLFISSVLPADMEKIIYLDCDTIIRGSLRRLWNTQQGKNIISGQKTQMDSFTYDMIFLQRNDVYVNCGILLINLALWRQYDVEEKFIKFIRLMGGKIPNNDQDTLNSVLKGYIGAIDPTYNCGPAWAKIKENPVPVPFDKVPDAEKIKNPVIVHFIGEDSLIGIYKRPWEADTDAKQGTAIVYPDVIEEWRMYKSMSSWADEPLRRSPEETKKKYENLVKIIKKCKPLYGLLLRIKKAASRFAGKIRKQESIGKYLERRQKITGIKIEDCRIEPR